MQTECIYLLHCLNGDNNNNNILSMSRKYECYTCKLSLKGLCWIESKRWWYDVTNFKIFADDGNDNVPDLSQKYFWPLTKISPTTYRNIPDLSQKMHKTN